MRSTLHAIELGLKAFLAKSGLTEAQLSKNPYGHDLVFRGSEAWRPRKFWEKH
jgi:hypothetical protein